MVIPDISIEVDKSLYLIEVKVDSPFNRYRFKGRSIDQIELYENIRDAKVFSLTKTTRKDQFPLNQSKYWFGVYALLREYRPSLDVETFLVKSFADYLKENGMNAERVTEKSCGLSEIGALMDQAVKSLKIYCGESNVKNLKAFFEPDNEAIGFYFRIRGKNSECYICVYFSDPGELAYSFFDEEIYITIQLVPEYFALSTEAQVDYFVNKLRSEKLLGKVSSLT